MIRLDIGQVEKARLARDLILHSGIMYGHMRLAWRPGHEKLFVSQYAGPRPGERELTLKVDPRDLRWEEWFCRRFAGAESNNSWLGCDYVMNAEHYKMVIWIIEDAESRTGLSGEPYADVLNGFLWWKFMSNQDQGPYLKQYPVAARRAQELMNILTRRMSRA